MYILQYFSYNKEEFKEKRIMAMNVIKKLFTYSPPPQSEPFVLTREPEPEYDVRKEKRVQNDYVSDNIEKNLAYIKKRYNVPLNNDFVIREIKLDNGTGAFVIFF